MHMKATWYKSNFLSARLPVSRFVYSVALRTYTKQGALYVKIA